MSIVPCTKSITRNVAEENWPINTLTTLQFFLHNCVDGIKHPKFWDYVAFQVLDVVKTSGDIKATLIVFVMSISQAALMRCTVVRPMQEALTYHSIA